MLLISLWMVMVKMELLGCENTNFMFLQIGDYDNNGFLDLYVKTQD